jgi:SAM-dependent methyltransferase
MAMDSMDRVDEIKQTVQEYYAGRASSGGCCSGETCGGVAPDTLDSVLGPSLGCGTPLAFAQVRPGETVVDLGSGAGGDVQRAAQQVGPQGRAIGVDMTPEMVWKAREQARRGGVANAEFYLGEIEHLPLADGSADIVISNCVINLAPDKGAVFADAFRVLRPGGRLVVSDMVSDGPIPESLRTDAAAWAACIAGAADMTEYLALIRGAGFENVETVASTSATPGQVYSVTVGARKPQA